MRAKSSRGQHAVVHLDSTTPSSNDTQVKPVRRKWNTEEEVALCNAWLGVSEDPRDGNAQRNEKFWERISDHWHRNLGRSKEDGRSLDMLSSKWRAIRLKVLKFGSIHKKRKDAKKSGGDNELIIMEEALRTFAVENGMPFAHIDAWRSLKDSVRFWATPALEIPSSSSKRTKTSTSNEYTTISSGRSGVNMDLNPSLVDIFEKDLGSNPTPTFEEHQNFATLSAPPRSLGRDKAKRVARTAEKQCFVQKIEVLLEKMERFIKYTDQKLLLEAKKAERAIELVELKKAKERREDMKFLMKNTSGLSNEDLELIERMKNEIRIKYR